MLITRETDYAMRIIRTLSKGKLEKAMDISQKEMIPKQFIYKIIKKMEKANIIQILQGAKGGCILTADLNELTLYDVMEAIGDEVLVNACTNSSYECLWKAENGDRCNYHKNLIEIQHKIEKELKGAIIGKVLYEEN